jgi:hypothetical protein
VTPALQILLETEELVALLAPKTLLEAFFRGMKYRSGVADSLKPGVSVFQRAVLTQDMQTKICWGLSTSNLQLSDIKLNFLGLFQQSSSACSSFETATD